MAYDEELANRIRSLIGDEPNVTEKAMFGGLAFLVNGNMSVAASSKGGLLLRVEPAQTMTHAKKPHAKPFDMRGKPMEGWLRVEPSGVTTDKGLAPWVKLSVAFARSLPPKAKSKTAMKTKPTAKRPTGAAAKSRR
ncbi:MAG TPA: TfoX/Sxy family protein [Kofleriaceae bacterium]|nr:TfoX/Sxy family protein [Kofleriaceae bacterium]